MRPRLIPLACMLAGVMVVTSAGAAWGFSFFGDLKGGVDSVPLEPGRHFGGFQGQALKFSAEIQRNEINWNVRTEYETSAPYECLRTNPLISTVTLLDASRPITVAAEDPVILQFPQGLTEFEGFFNNGMGFSGADVPLPSGIDCLPLAGGGTLCAEPGHQLVLMDLDGFPDGGYGYAVTFIAPSADPVSFKVIFAAKVLIGNGASYVPLLPCTNSFADIAAITLPTVSGSLVDVTPDFDEAELFAGCSDLQIDLDLSQPAPLLSGYSLAALAAVLFLGALHRLNQRRKRMSHSPR